MKRTVENIEYSNGYVYLDICNEYNEYNEVAYDYSDDKPEIIKECTCCDNNRLLVTENVASYNKNIIICVCKSCGSEVLVNENDII